ncbi:MAG: hypothetical protein AAFU86_11970 [Pseudomonadota bacterium]
MIRAFTAADADAALTLYRHLVGDQPVADHAAFAQLIAHPGTRFWVLGPGRSRRPW